MSEPLPLAAAAHRLRHRPGRPRAIPSAVASQASALPAALPLTRANARTVAVVWLRSQPSKDADGGKRAAEWLPYSARLLSLTAAAGYLGVSTWVIRGWMAKGLLSRVKLPGVDGGEVERLLFDVTDLDQLIEAGKD